MSKWKVTYILDTDEESTEVTADDERGARYEAQRQFGSPIEITKVDELRVDSKITDDPIPCPATENGRSCCYREGHDLAIFPHRFPS